MWKGVVFVCLKNGIIMYLQVIRKIMKNSITHYCWTVGKKIRNWNTRTQNNSGAQIPGAMTSRRLNFVLGRLIFMVNPYGTSLVSPFRYLEFRGSSYIFGKFVHHCKTGVLKISPQTSVINFSLQCTSRHISTVQVTPFYYCIHHAISLLHASRYFAFSSFEMQQHTPGLNPANTTAVLRQVEL